MTTAVDKPVWTGELSERPLLDGELQANGGSKRESQSLPGMNSLPGYPVSSGQPFTYSFTVE